MKDEKHLQIGPREAWYGLCVEDGVDLPITRESRYSRSLTPNETVNGAAAIWFPATDATCTVSAVPVSPLKTGF